MKAIYGNGWQNIIQISSTDLAIIGRGVIPEGEDNQLKMKNAYTSWASGQGVVGAELVTIDGKIINVCGPMVELAS